MDVSKPCPGKSHPCKKRACQHVGSCFPITAVCHVGPDAPPNEFHCLFAHGLGKRRCMQRNVCFLCMDQRIHPTGSCHRCRSRCKKCRIQQRVCRDQLIGKYGQLIISLMIRDDGKGSHLRSGSGSCRNGDQRDDLPRNLVCTFIFCDAAAVFCHNTDSFCHIHRGTPTKSNNKIRSACPERFCCTFHSLHGWISFCITEGADCNAGLCKDFFTLPHYAKSVQCGAGNDKAMFSSKLPGCPGKLL